MCRNENCNFLNIYLSRDINTLKRVHASLRAWTAFRLLMSRNDKNNFKPMDNIKNILQNIGLSKTESEIYLAGLSYETIGVKELQKITNIKRTTIYASLNSLIQKGLVAKKEIGERMVFEMSRPENFKRLIEKQISDLKDKQKDFEEIIPVLNKQKNPNAPLVKVSHFEGIEGIKLVVDEALYCKKKEWDIIAPRKNFFSDFDKKYANYFLESRKQRGIIARSLWEYDPQRRMLSEEEIEQRNPAILPKIMHGKFKDVIIIFDDKVAIISSIKELSAIIIQSQEIHDMFKTMFEGLWLGSKDYRVYKDK